MSNTALYPFFVSKKAVWLVGCILFGGILFFAWNNRISIDDMFFYATTKETGLKNMVLEQYYKFSGRFAAYTLNGFTMYYFNHFMLTVWNIVSIVCFFLAFKFFIRSSTYLPSLSGAGWIFLFSAILFGCTHPGEEFFWYTQVNTYLWSATCALFILAVILSPTSTLLPLVALVPTCFFVGGSSESIFIQMAVLLTIIIRYNWKKFSPQKKLFVLISFSLMIAAGYINIFSPGNQARSELIATLTNTGFFEAFAQSAYSYVMSENALIRYVWALPFVFAMSFYLKPAIQQLSFIRTTLLFGVLMLFFITPTAWALREPAPARALITCDILTFLYLIMVLQKINIFQKIPFATGYLVGLVTLLTAVGIYGYQTHQYSKAYDQRDAWLKSSPALKNLKSLPPCRMYKVATGSSREIELRHALMYYDMAF